MVGYFLDNQLPNWRKKPKRNAKSYSKISNLKLILENGKSGLSPSYTFTCDSPYISREAIIWKLLEKFANLSCFLSSSFNLASETSLKVLNQRDGSTIYDEK